MSSSQSFSHWFQDQIRPLTKPTFWLPMAAMVVIVGGGLHALKEEKGGSSQDANGNVTDGDSLLFSEDLSQEDIDSLLLMQEFDRASAAISSNAFNNLDNQGSPSSGLFDAVINQGEGESPLNLSLPKNVRGASGPQGYASAGQGGSFLFGGSQSAMGMGNLGGLGRSNSFVGYSSLSGIGNSANGTQQTAAAINPLQAALDRDLANNGQQNTASRSAGGSLSLQAGNLSANQANGSSRDRGNLLATPSYGNQSYPGGYGNVVGGQLPNNLGFSQPLGLPNNPLGAGRNGGYGNSASNAPFNPATYLPPASYGIPPAIQSGTAVPAAAPLNIGSPGQRSSQVNQFSNQGINNQFSNQGINSNLNNQGNQLVQPPPPFSAPRRVPGSYIGGGQINSFSNP